MNDETKPDEITITITAKVDPEWVKYCTQHSDLFSRDYCGYWLRGVEHDSEIGWLVWEDDEKCPPGKEPHRKEAFAAWRTGEALPSNWFRLDKEAALRAWAEGVKACGIDWYEDGDANTYDYVIQMALLGEERYA